MRLRNTIWRAQKLQMGTQDVLKACRHSSACENHEDNGSMTTKRIRALHIKGAVSLLKPQRTQFSVLSTDWGHCNLILANKEEFVLPIWIIVGFFFFFRYRLFMVSNVFLKGQQN